MKQNCKKKNSVRGQFQRQSERLERPWKGRQVRNGEHRNCGASVAGVTVTRE